MPGFKLGLGCDCCESGCTARINVIMSDGASMADSGVTVTVVVRDDADAVVATFGPSSPDASSVQFTEELTAGEAYTATLTVEQEDGTTCEFVRDFTTPDPCAKPFSVNLFIPRVWVAFYYCNSCRSLDSWGMPIAVAGPDDFEISGFTTEYPDPPPVFLGDVPKLKFAFTPCTEGEYTITPTLGVPNTAVDPIVHEVDWPGGATDGTAAMYFIDYTPLSLANTIKPATGYVWPRACNEPVPSTLHLSSENFGSGTLEAVADGECGDGWAGTTGGTIPDCEGGETGVGAAWLFRIIGDSWVLSATVSEVCLCRVLDAYGACRWTVVGGGTGEVTIVGTQATGAPCGDCSALDLTFAVAPLSLAGVEQCPDQAGFCAMPPDDTNVRDSVTLTV